MFYLTNINETGWYLVSHSASLQMVVLLVGDSEQRLETVGGDVVLTVLPLHSLTLSVSGDGADRLGHCPTFPGEQSHIHIIAEDRLVLDGSRGFSAVVSVHQSGDLTRLESAVFPCDVPAVLISCPDLFSGSVEDPLCVALLLGNVPTDRHHLCLSQGFLHSRLAHHGNEVIYLEVVVSGGNRTLIILALREAHDHTVEDWNILAEIFRPLRTLSIELIVAKLHHGVIEAEVSVVGDVHTVLAVVVVLPCLDDGEREQGEDDLHGWMVVGL